MLRMMFLLLLQGLVPFVAAYSMCPGNVGTYTVAVGSTTAVTTGSYFANWDCRTTLQANTGVQWTLLFSSFNVESGYDFFRIYDETGTILYTFSGFSTPGAISIIGSSISLGFTSDSSVQYTGVSLSVSTSALPATNSPTTAPTVFGATSMPSSRAPTRAPTRSPTRSPTWSPVYSFGAARSAVNVGLVVGLTFMGFIIMTAVVFTIIIFKHRNNRRLARSVYPQGVPQAVVAYPQPAVGFYPQPGQPPYAQYPPGGQPPYPQAYPPAGQPPYPQTGGAPAAFARPVPYVPQPRPYGQEQQQQAPHQSALIPRAAFPQSPEEGVATDADAPPPSYTAVNAIAIEGSPNTDPMFRAA